MTDQSSCIGLKKDVLVKAAVGQTLSAFSKYLRR